MAIDTADGGKIVLVFANLRQLSNWIGWQRGLNNEVALEYICYIAQFKLLPPFPQNASSLSESWDRISLQQ